MTSTKNYFDQILKNQNKLMESLTDYVTKAADVAVPEPKVVEKTEELVKEYVEYALDLTGKEEDFEQYKTDFWGKMNERYSKNMEVSKNLYEKTLELYKDLWSQNMVVTQQERMKKLAEIYQNSLKMYIETTSANAKVMEDYFKSNIEPVVKNKK